MDIAGLSMSLAQTKTLNDVGTAVLAKSLDTMEDMGDTITNLIDSSAMELSVNPSVGGNIDIRV